MSANLSKKIVYWFSPTTKEWRMGLPEAYPAPDGFEKVVCNTAHEAELCSEKMRTWEAMNGEINNQKREMVEGPIRDALRKQILWQISNARNAINREFLERHLMLYDKREDRTKQKRISYLHSEAYEQHR
jgi:hypothetical protein